MGREDCPGCEANDAAIVGNHSFALALENAVREAYAAVGPKTIVLHLDTRDPELRAFAFNVIEPGRLEVPPGHCDKCGRAA